MFEDLLMLMHRHPVEVGSSARERWNDQYERAVESWLLRRENRETGQPTGGGRFWGTLRPFQEEGVRFMQASRRSLLADDMGLGKTVQAFAFLDRIDDWPAVVVCQSHVQRHWETKAPQFLAIDRATGTMLDRGMLTWAPLIGTKPERGAPKADLYVVHYLVLHGWVGWLLARGIKTVILDECQEARHSGTRKHDAIRALCRSARNVVGLSGTPIYNRGPEIYTVMNTISRGCLGTKKDFEENWCAYSEGKLVVEDPAMLGQYLVDRKLMLRRRKDEVATELPAKHRVIEPLEGDQSTFSELVREAVKLAKDAAFVANPFDRSRMEAEALAMTRRATGVAKTPAVIAFLRGLMEAGQPTLVFAHHKTVHAAICDTLDEFSPVRITGEETAAIKAKNQARFESGESDLCVIALRAATGLDGLQKRARVVVFAELDWSPAVHKQAEDRAHRIGQSNSVLVYYLVADLGTDPFMLDALNVKESQFLGLMHDHAETEQDRASAVSAAAKHQQDVLTMLRARR